MPTALLHLLLIASHVFIMIGAAFMVMDASFGAAHHTNRFRIAFCWFGMLLGILIFILAACLLVPLVLV